LAREAQGTAEALADNEKHLAALKTDLARAKSNDGRNILIGLAALIVLGIVGLWAIGGAIRWVGDRLEGIFASRPQVEEPAASEAPVDAVAPPATVEAVVGDPGLPSGVEAYAPPQPLGPNNKAALVMTGASADSAVVGVLEQNTAANIIGRTTATGSAWFYVQMPDGTYGYIAADGLAALNPASAPPAPVAPALGPREAPGAPPVVRRVPSGGDTASNEKPTGDGAQAIGPPVVLVTPSIVGEYAGTYTCEQGITGMRLTFRAQQGNAYEATFDFFPIRQNPTVPAGRAIFRGNLDPNSRQLTLTGERWLHRPPGYSFIELQGRFDRSFQQFSGSIPTAGCSTFTTTRQN
jgi:hypothetical protein